MESITLKFRVLSIHLNSETFESIRNLSVNACLLQLSDKGRPQGGPCALWHVQSLMNTIFPNVPARLLDGPAVKNS